MTSDVTRVGDTVRRPRTAASPFVASLLQLLEQRGFTGAPQYLGQSRDRDIFSYVDGEVPEHFRPWSDAQVAAAGALLRALHDATRGSTLAGRFPVICHHDPGPNNAVFPDGLSGMPRVFIDYDEAAPGHPLEDVGYASWAWCCSSRASAPSVDRQAKQVRILADSYGMTEIERSVLTDAILERLARNVRFWAQQLAAPRSIVVADETVAARIAWSREEHDFVHTHRATFDRALS